MTREDFMRIFIDVSNKIISLGIDKGYFDPSKKEELEDKLRNSINKDIQELDDSHGLAYLNPNNQTLGFNINQITTEGYAIILILLVCHWTTKRTIFKKIKYEWTTIPGNITWKI